MDKLETIMRGDKRKNPEKVFYRLLSYDECRSLTGHSYILDRYGHAARVKITSVKTWKRRPDVEVHCKYGMYEFFTIRIHPENPNTELIALLPSELEQAKEQKAKEIIQASYEAEERELIENPSCPICEGIGIPLGSLGNITYFRCQSCGMDFSA